MPNVPHHSVQPKLKGKGQKPITNLVGRKFHMLEVIDIEQHEAGIRWLCRCDCGKTKSILGTHLLRGLIRSCGCARAQMISDAKLEDLTGQTFCRWTVLGQFQRVNDNSTWLCKCSCGKEKRVLAGHLVSGASQSCGCLAREITSITNSTHGGSRDGKRIREFSVWCGMRARCKHHPDYAGRGISICDGWNDFAVFFADMGEMPSHLRSIERIDNGGGYWCGHCDECQRLNRKANCKWADYFVQANNRRNNVILTYQGLTQTASQWDRSMGHRPGTVSARIKKGLSVYDAITRIPRGQAALKIL